MEPLSKMKIEDVFEYDFGEEDVELDGENEKQK